MTILTTTTVKYSEIISEVVLKYLVKMKHYELF